MGLEIKRGDIFLVDLEHVRESEQGKCRPALVIQNNLGNTYSPITIIAAITSKKFNEEYPNNVHIKSNESDLEQDSTVLLNQIRIIDKSRIIKFLGKLSEEDMKKVDLALKISLDL